MALVVLRLLFGSQGTFSSGVIGGKSKVGICVDQVNQEQRCPSGKTIKHRGVAHVAKRIHCGALLDVAIHIDDGGRIHTEVPIRRVEDGHVLHVGRDTHVGDLDSVATAGDLDEPRIDGEGLSVKTSRSGELDGGEERLTGPEGE